MKQCGPNYRALVLVIVFACQAALPLKTVAQARSNACPPVRLAPPVLLRESGATATLQPPTILVCRLDKEINSKTAQMGDRVEARVVEPISDRRGALIVPRNSKVIGRINRVYRASASRPALIEVGFASLQRCRGTARGGRTSDGCNARNADIVPLTGVLTPLTKENCKAINSDGSLEARGPSANRDFAFVAGGAGGGAIVGGLVTGALLGAGVGAGIGAGVGAAATLFGRGKHVKVAANTKFGVELTRPLLLRSPNRSASLGSRALNRPVNPPVNRPPSSQPNWGSHLIPVREIKLTQEQNGEIRILANGIAPNNTWDVYLENTGVQNGVLYLNLMGYPTQNWAANQAAPVRKQTQFSWSDAYHQVKRVVVRGENNSRSQAYVHPPGSGAPGDISQAGPEPAADPTGQRITRQLDALARDYERDLDGGLRALRGTSSSQTQLLSALKRAAEAARVFRAPLTPENKRSAASKLSFRADAVNQAIAAVPGFPSGYRQRWQTIQADVDYLAENTTGVIRP